MIYGGWILILIDMVLSCVVYIILNLGEIYIIIFFMVNMVCFLKLGSGEVICEGVVVYCGFCFVIVEGDFKDVNGKLIVYGMVFCMIMLIG